jgi:hypothetical protein
VGPPRACSNFLFGNACRVAPAPPALGGGESEITASTLGIISLPSGDVLALQLGFHPVGLRHKPARLESGHPDALAPRIASGGHAPFVYYYFLAIVVCLRCIRSTKNITVPSKPDKIIQIRVHGLSNRAHSLSERTVPESLRFVV